MITSKSTKIILLTIAITAIVLFMKTDSYQRVENELRELVTDEEIDNICNAAFGNKYSDAVLNYTKVFEDRAAELESIFVPDKSEDYKLLINYLKDQTQTKGVIDYVVKRASPYIIFIAFAVISLITWIILIFCCCRPCCCCKKSEKDGGCKVFSIIALIVCYAGIIIGCVIGFIYSSKFVESLNGSSCALLVFYQTAVKGEDSGKSPRWIGINNIANILDDTLTAIDTITQNVATAFNAQDGNTDDLADFKTTLQTSYNTFSPRKIKNPNPAASLSNGITEITPIYIENYGAFDKKDTILNSIFQEFEVKLQATFEFRQTAEDASKEIEANSNEVRTKIQDIKTIVDELKKPFDTISADLLSNQVNAQNQIDKIGIIGFLILFAILISLSCLSIVILFCYGSCCKWQGCRLVLHLIWWIFSLIMILTFILGGAFGIIGLIGQDGTPIIRWIFGTENLSNANPAIFGPGDIKDYLNTCINLDGDLPTRNFNIEQSNAAQLDILYSASRNLVDTKKLLEANKNSEAVSKLNSQFSKLQGDITLTTSPTLGQNNINAIINELRGWSDSSLNKYQTQCSTASLDAWVHNVDSCPSGYTNAGPSGSSSPLGSRSCLLLTDNSASSVNSRYSSQTGCQISGSPDFDTVVEAIRSYVEELNTYIQTNKDLIDELIANNNEIDGQFVAIAERVIDFLTRMSNIIEPLVELFENIVGDQGLFKIVNCGFMKTGLERVYVELESGLSPRSFSLGGVIIAVSFLEYLSVIFLLIVINKLRKNKSKMDSNERVNYKV